MKIMNISDSTVDAFPIHILSAFTEENILYELLFLNSYKYKKRITSLYNQLLRKMTQRKTWTQFQVNALRCYREECQVDSWAEVASKIIQIHDVIHKNQKQCEDRYVNSLNHNLNLSDWRQVDQLQLIDCHRKYGNKWTIIAENFKGRTDSFIKNHFYSRVRKSIRKLNRLAQEQLYIKYKKLNLNIIFKLTNLVQDKLTKISQDVRDYYERLMYNLIDFSLKTQQGARQYDMNEIQIFVLALTSLENLSGAIGTNRKPKRGRGHKKEQRYPVSTDGLFLVLVDDELILKRQTQPELRPSVSVISYTQNMSQNQPQSPESSQQEKPVQDSQYIQKTSETGLKTIQDKNSLIQSKEVAQKTNNDFLTKVQIEEEISSKETTQLTPQLYLLNQDSILNDHQVSSYSAGIMEYIMQNSFEYNQNMPSLSEQGSFQYDDLF